jgi:hypothetical protein
MKSITDLPPELLYNILEREPINNKIDLIGVSKRYRLFNLTVPRNHYRKYYDLVIKELIYKIIDDYVGMMPFDELEDELAMLREKYIEYNVEFPKSYYKLIFIDVLFSLRAENLCDGCYVFTPFNHHYIRRRNYGFLVKFCCSCYEKRNHY